MPEETLDDDARRENKTFFKNHEDMSKRRVRKFQEELDSLSQPAYSLQELKHRLEIQAQIEDLIIKFHTAEHVSWTLYGAIGMTALGLAGALVGFVVTHFLKL